MSDFTINAKVENVTLDVTVEEGVSHRKCGLKLGLDFDATLAAALGGSARQALEALKSHGMEKVYVDTERLVLAGKIVGPTEEVAVRRMWGRQAVFAASKKSDDPPTARLEFEAFYSDELWLFLGKHGGGIVQLNFKPAQLELAKAAG